MWLFCCKCCSQLAPKPVVRARKRVWRKLALLALGMQLDCTMPSHVGKETIGCVHHYSTCPPICEGEKLRCVGIIVEVMEVDWKWKETRICTSWSRESACEMKLNSGDRGCVGETQKARLAEASGDLARQTRIEDKHPSITSYVLSALFPQ